MTAKDRRSGHHRGDHEVPGAMGDRLIVALDETELAPALRLARRLQGVVRTMKVGSALFTACGPSTVARLRALGFDVMLDLKFFDIPNTVKLSCEVAAELGVSLLTVHAAGEPAMLEAAVAGAKTGARRTSATRPLVLGVTVLTSVASVASAARTAASSMTAGVLALAHKALEAGCDGVVASAQDAAAIRRRLGARPRLVCPGIRPTSEASGSGDDQRRVATPAEALAAGADLLVIGRPITAAPDPRASAYAILHEMEDVK